jgi:tRNA-2-methylthio-N6-dimethylallyladenosine synthase
MPPKVPEEELRAQSRNMLAVRDIADRPQTYAIVTYGCQMNAHDSETIAGMLAEMGLTEATSREEADLVLFNTCCIRDNAERKALGNMTWLKQIKRNRPEMILCVCGCMMQQHKMAQTILRQYPFFDIAFGTHTLHRFPELLLRALETRRQVIEVEASEGCIAEGLPVRRTSPHKAFLTVMYGCNNYCSYCIVPYVRGRERSRDPGDILREAEALLTDGVQEIMLLGQNVNSYGNDLTGDASFPALLRQLNALGVPRIRFMTSHPKDLSDELIRAMADSPHVARHLHLPVQSGSDAMLSAMRRVYTRDAYLQRVEALRAAIPGIALTTDLIVGFPGETEADFADTCSLVEAVRYDSAYTFIFSPREGTKAADMQPRIPDDIATDRIARLIALQEGITAEIHQSLVGSQQRVLVDEVSRRRTDQVAGKTDRGITCNFTGDAALVGQFIDVRVTAPGHNTLKAERE